MRSFEPIARLTELSPRSIENQPNVASVEMLLQRNVCYVRSGYSCSINQGKMKTYEFIYFWRDLYNFYGDACHAGRDFKILHSSNKRPAN